MILTENAKKYIKLFLSQKDPGLVFRIGVETGGCSGFSYKISVTAANADDVRVCVEPPVMTDPISNQLLETLTVDYQAELHFSGFTFTNPSVKSNCGCGQSFDV